jgi:biotin synthase
MTSSVQTNPRAPFAGEATRILTPLSQQALANEPPSAELLKRIFNANEVPLLLLLEAARQVREHYCGKEVRIQILNNLQNGQCTEDCNYCAQATSSTADIQTYSLKSDNDIMEGARVAAASGATRYCMVLSGRGPTRDRVNHLAEIVRTIKRQFNIEVCVSAGFLDTESAMVLKEAGLNRYNHNVNTSSCHYGRICTSHLYADRIATLEAARSAGLDLCSGLIIGMGETLDDLVEIATTLRRLEVKSVPVNFYMHIPGSRLGEVGQLTPDHCLRALCLFRFALPQAEIRAAGGREVNLRSLQPLALFPANSIFCQGYLNSTGQDLTAAREMIRDTGYLFGEVEP